MPFVVGPSLNPVTQLDWAGLRAGDAPQKLAHPKENAVECEPYRRLVAKFPCAHCSVEGFSQAAHPPPTGKSIKEDDRECFPLCCTRPGIEGCHVQFDQYRLIPKGRMRAQAAKWARETLAKIKAMGKLPKKLAALEEKQHVARVKTAQRAMKYGAKA